jgi:hypothetical protein
MRRSSGTLPAMKERQRRGMKSYVDRTNADRQIDIGVVGIERIVNLSPGLGE